MKDARVRASKVLKGPAAKYNGDKQEVHRADSPGALRLEDLQLRPRLRADCRPRRRSTTGRSTTATCALLWRGGCIIRAVFLDRIKEAFDADPKLENLLLAPYFAEAVDEGAGRLAARGRRRPRELGIPVPAFATALAYYDGYRRDRLPANLLQAQRDYFGAHTYERIDKPGVFHAEWLRPAKEAAGNAPSSQRSACSDQPERSRVPNRLIADS